MPPALPLPVRSVIAPPQDAQKQIPVSKVGPLTARGGIHFALRAFNAAWTASNSTSVMIGGPPCQGFSQIGPRNLDDPRNRLYEEFIRVVRLLNPTAPCARELSPRRQAPAAAQ
jgi:C-5 cytosine-specific DNA methylase